MSLRTLGGTAEHKTIAQTRQNPDCTKHHAQESALASGMRMTPLRAQCACCQNAHNPARARKSATAHTHDPSRSTMRMQPWYAQSRCNARKSTTARMTPFRAQCIRSHDALNRAKARKSATVRTQPRWDVVRAQPKCAQPRQSEGPHYHGDTLEYATSHNPAEAGLGAMCG